MEARGLLRGAGRGDDQRCVKGLRRGLRAEQGWKLNLKCPPAHACTVYFPPNSVLQSLCCNDKIIIVLTFSGGLSLLPF